MICVEHLLKKYRHNDKYHKISWKTAVDDISFSIPQGMIFGLLGPNGAGKTTTIRMLTMLTEPTSGKILYDGTDINGHEREMKRIIGVVPQQVNFDQDLTIGENLELHARLHHMGYRERHARIAELLHYMEMEDVVNDNIRQLSGGMKRRVLIARALIHRPKVLFMDEPTVALDPQVRRRIWDLVRKMAYNGTTVLLTTHYIEEAEKLCSNVAIMNKGKIIAEDTPEAFCKSLGRYVVEWDENGERKYRFFSDRRDAAELMSSLETDALLRESNLEDAFIEITGRSQGL